MQWQDDDTDDNNVIINVLKLSPMFYYRAAIRRGAKLIKDHGGGNLPVEKYEFYTDLF